MNLSRPCRDLAPRQGRLEEMDLLMTESLAGLLATSGRENHDPILAMLKLQNPRWAQDRSAGPEKPSKDAA